MYLIAGLGNPGKEYEGTKHNVGFDAVAELARRWKIKLMLKRRYKAETAETSYGGEQVLLAAPQTFMNKSGEAAAEILKYRDIPTEKVIVVHDEMDLPVGTVKIKKGGGSAGHNGISSIAASIGSKEFIRIRIGIGKPGDKDTGGADHVLSGFSRSERKAVEGSIMAACDAAEAIISEGLHKAMNRFNTSQKENK